MNVCRRAAVVAIIWCAVAHFGGVPGGVQHAVEIARRESTFRPEVTSPAGAMGVYQFMPSTWSYHVAHWPALARAVGRDPYNARANVMFAIRVAHETGWGPWSTA